MWSLKGIRSHKGPLLPTPSEYKVSSYNVLVKWDGGSEYWGRTDEVTKDDPVSAALYSNDSNLQ
jgi:hypothetical protein